MSSRAISGKPGGGKSYYAVILIIDELRSGDRPIVTNLPLNLQALQDYFSETLEIDVDVFSRVTLLAWEDFKDFWRYRGNGFIAPDVTPAEFSAGIRPDWAKFPKNGVFYVLDEVHEHLNSRQWATTGPLLLFYIMKHRHLGDDVLWITQSVMNVDRQWRSSTQDYTYCRNWRKEKFRGFVKGSGFTATLYLEPFTGLQQPQEEKKYSLDKKIAACYNTSIANTAADTNEKISGPPIKILYIALGVFLFLIAGSFGFGPKILKYFLTPKISSSSISLPSPTPIPTPSPTPTPPPVPSPTPSGPFFHNFPLGAISSPALFLDFLRKSSVNFSYDSENLYASFSDYSLYLKILDFFDSLPPIPPIQKIYLNFLGYSGGLGSKPAVLLDDSYSRLNSGYVLGDQGPFGKIVAVTPFAVVQKNSRGQFFCIINNESAFSADAEFFKNFKKDSTPSTAAGKPSRAGDE